MTVGLGTVMTGGWVGGAGTVVGAGLAGGDVTVVGGLVVAVPPPTGGDFTVVGVPPTGFGGGVSLPLTLPPRSLVSLVGRQSPVDAGACPMTDATVEANVARPLLVR
ncbi:MAG: hypothetical protein QOJ74_779, partial [Ilumatobacteraceae bacterium]|nr:hypothetical protein [Ilumatobacteraceae bacterium]